MRAMIKVGRMPSYRAEPLKVESYTTTPRSLALESSSGKRVSHDSQGETESSVEEESSKDGVTDRAGVRSAPSHFSAKENDNLTEKLLENSEQWSLNDTLQSLVFESSVVDDWSEAASGWDVVVPYPKYFAQQQPPPHQKSQSTLKKSSFSARTAVRCVDEDFGDHYCPSWKGNVEPVTYRYVPNNGYYRNHKPMRDMREWPFLRKTKSEKSRMTPEMRYAQKTLKRDLESRFRNGGEDAPDTSVKPVTEQRDCISEAKPLCRRPKCEQQLIKSASDLFMEKFNTRLSALEKELQIPRAAVVSKRPTPESTSAPSHSPRHLSKKLKEVRGQEAMKPTIQMPKQHGSDFGEDLFTVKPMCKPEVPLRPLEKLTPKQKRMEKSSTATSQERSPSPETQSAEEEEDDLMIVLACATSHHPPPLQKDLDISGISTARSAIAMTNFDIEKMRNVPLHSELGGSKPRSTLTQKEGGGGAGRGTMRYTVGGAGGSSSHPPDQPSVEEVDRKDTLPHVDRPLDGRFGSMSNALPEIMGKRLSVIAATHRLL